jgi:hypothetical protein
MVLARQLNLQARSLTHRQLQGQEWLQMLELPGQWMSTAPLWKQAWLHRTDRALLLLLVWPRKRLELQSYHHREMETMMQ